MDHEWDGATLRLLRQRSGKSLRAMAELANLSHGYLSKVERGDYGRPVTPAILRAYRRALGLDPAAWSAHRPTALSPAGLQHWLARIGSLAAGGPLRPAERNLNWAAPPMPAHPDPGTFEVLLRVTRLLAVAGAGTGPVGRAFVHWLMRSPGLYGAHRPLQLAIGELALGSAEQAGAHPAARGMYLVALHAAVSGDDPDLRARVLVAVATRLRDHGYRPAGDRLVWLAGADDRISEDARLLLKEFRHARS